MLVAVVAPLNKESRIKNQESSVLSEKEKSSES